jgi:hypothetical protein
LYQDTQPLGGFGPAQRLSAQESKSVSWLTNPVGFTRNQVYQTHENEAQGKRNLEVKDAAEEYLTPEEPNES